MPWLIFLFFLAAGPPEHSVVQDQWDADNHHVLPLTDRHLPVHVLALRRVPRPGDPRGSLPHPEGLRARVCWTPHPTALLVHHDGQDLCQYIEERSDGVREEQGHSVGGIQHTVLAFIRSPQSERGVTT